MGATVSEEAAQVFLNLPSLLLVLAVLAGGLLMSFRPSQVGGAILCALRRAGEQDTAKLASHAAVLDRAHQLCWAGGLFTFLMGLVVMLRNLDNPDMIGPGMAAAALPLLYGVLLAEFLFAPLKHRLIARHPQTLAAGRPAGRVNRTTAGFVVASVLFLVVSLGLMINMNILTEAHSARMSPPPAAAPATQPAPPPVSTHMQSTGRLRSIHPRSTRITAVVRSDAESRATSSRTR
jgi:hypothetical protein